MLSLSKHGAGLFGSLLRIDEGRFAMKLSTWNRVT